MTRASGSPDGAAGARDHILCVDDEPRVLHVLERQLEPFADRCEVLCAGSADEALALLDALERREQPLALIITDQRMPGRSGAELLEIVHRRCPRAGKILLTGNAPLDAVIHAMNKGGLNRYISKPWERRDLMITVESLLHRYSLEVENQLLVGDLRRKNEQLVRLNRSLEARVRERTAELTAANERLSLLVVTDGLTGQYNHRHFHERLVLEIERSARSRLPFSLLMIDLDRFKSYNDAHGHLAGDVVLRKVAESIAEGRRANDTVARYGGDEFGVLLPDTSHADALSVAERVRARVARAAVGVEPGDITLSAGLAVCPDHTTEPRELLLAADAALYRAKERGGDRVETAPFPDRREDGDEDRSSWPEDA